MEEEEQQPQDMNEALRGIRDRQRDLQARLGDRLWPKPESDEEEEKERGS